MGYDIRTLNIIARVSRHNSEQDALDDAAWERLIKEVEQLLVKPEYRAINANVS